MSWASCDPVPEQRSAPQASLPTPDPEAITEARVIELVKHSHALKYVSYDSPPGAIPLGGGDPAKTDTEHAVVNELRRMRGDLRVIGWKASRFDDQHYLVTYSWILNEETRGFPFEVNTAADLVRYIANDPALIKKYDLGHQ